MSVIAAILWTWLAVSLAIYAYRVYRRVTKGSQTPGAERGNPAATSSDPSKPMGAASALIQNPVAGFENPPAPAESVVPAESDSPATPSPPAPPAPLVPAMPDPSDAEVVAAWTAPAPGDLSASERRTARRPISEAVTGIRLPCDLAPLVGDASRIDPFDVSFFTTTHDGDSVRGAIAGELVRLGYQVATTSTFRLGASRADAEMAVTIYPDPPAATEGGRQLFPSASGDSVVVRFQS